MNPFKVLVDREKDIQRIAKHFGSNAQRAKAIEELAEATKELSGELVAQVLTGDSVFTQETLEELADVLVMIAQLSYFADCECPDDHIIAKVVASKIDRTLRRIESGFYELAKESASDLYESAVESLQELMTRPDGFKDILRMYLDTLAPNMQQDTLDSLLDSTSKFAPSFIFEDGRSVKITFSLRPDADGEGEEA